MTFKHFAFLAIFVSCIAVNTWGPTSAYQAPEDRTTTHYGPAF
jgi:hypothetical protein